MTTVEKIWIYNSDTQKWSHIQKSSEKLDFNWSHNSKNMVKFTFRKSWLYVYWGYTKEEVIEAHNSYNNKKIAELKETIKGYESQNLKL